MDIEVQETTPKAIEAIERNGGKVRCVYYHRVDLDTVLHPEKYVVVPETPLLPTKKELIGTRLLLHLG